MRYKIGSGIIWLSLLAVLPVHALGSSWSEYEIQGLRLAAPALWVTAPDEANSTASIEGQLQPVRLNNPQDDALLLIDSISQSNLELTVEPNDDSGSPSDARLEMLAIMAPKALKDMGIEYGIDVQVHEVSVVRLPAGKAVHIWMELDFHSELSPGVVSREKYIFLSADWIYTLDLSTYQASFAGMEPIFDRVAHSVRIDDYRDAWIEHHDAADLVSFRLPPVWVEWTQHQDALQFAPADSSLALVVEKQPQEGINKLDDLESHFTALLAAAGQEVASLEKLYLPSGSYLRVHVVIETGVAEQYLFATYHEEHILIFRFSMQTDKFGIMARTFEQIMNTVRLRDAGKWKT